MKLLKVLALANGDYFSDVLVDDDFENEILERKFIEIQVREGKSIRRISINPDFILSFE